MSDVLSQKGGIIAIGEVLVKASGSWPTCPTGSTCTKAYCRHVGRGCARIMIQLSQIGYQVANPLPSYQLEWPDSTEFLRTLWLFIAYRIPMRWCFQWLCALCDSRNLREPQHTPGAYPTPPQTPKWKEFLHKLLVLGLGYVPGVCWQILGRN